MSKQEKSRSYPRFSRWALLDVLTALLILAGGVACASTSAAVTSSPDITIIPSESDTLN